MPRLRQISKSEATSNVKKFYEALFGDREPVAEPGTATGIPGNWWTALRWFRIFSSTPPITLGCSVCSVCLPAKVLASWIIKFVSWELCVPVMLGEASLCNHNTVKWHDDSVSLTNR